MKKIARNTLALSLLFMTMFSNGLLAQSVGAKAPDFSLQTLSGETFTLSKQQNKVVFIFLFGNNCPHCLSNGPRTESGIYKLYKSNPNFVAVGIDVWDGSNSSVTSFKNRAGLTYTMLVKGSSVASTYGSTYDRMLIVDQEGILRYKATANASSGVVAQAAGIIEDLLAVSTGIENDEITSNELQVYPNPVQNIVNIQTGYEPGTDFELNMMDITGKVVIDGTFQPDHSGRVELNLEKYPAGMYFLRTKSGDENKVVRFLIAN